MTILNDIEIVLNHELSVAKKRIKELINTDDEDIDEEDKEINERLLRYYCGRAEAFQEALEVVKGGYDRS